MTIGRLTLTRAGRVKRARLPNVGNNPPVWDTQPTPSFIEGEAKNYSIAGFASDPDDDALTYTLNTGTVALPAGVTWNQAQSRLEYDGVGAATSSSGHVFSASDGTDSTESSAFDIVISSGFAYPRVYLDFINNRDYCLDNSTGVAMRAEMAKVPYITLGLFQNGPWDNNDGSYLTRQEFLDDMLTRNPDLVMTDYTNVMEFGDTSTNNQEIRDWINNTQGFASTPPGWAASENDHWARNSSGDRVSSFPGSYNTNITDYPLTDAQGRGWPERYGDFILDNMFYVTTPKDGGLGSYGVYIDVCDPAAKKSGIDWDGDGSNEDAQDGYQDGGAGEEAANKWRAGQVRFLNRLLAQHPNMLSVVNMTTHLANGYGDAAADIAGEADGADSTDMSFIPVQIPSYYQTFNGGHVQNNSLESPAFPEAGIGTDGAELNSGGNANWQKVYNTIVQALESTVAPNIVVMDWQFDLTGPVSDWIRDINGGALNGARWGFVTSQLCGAFFYLNDNAKFYAYVAFMDETGLVNTGSTGLSAGWLGEAIDGVQKSPRQGTNIWAREWENGWGVVNTDLTGTATTVDISLFGGAGQVKRINGVQDATTNDGSTINANFDLDPRDALFLEKV